MMDEILFLQINLHECQAAQANLMEELKSIAATKLNLSNDIYKLAVSCTYIQLRVEQTAHWPVFMR